jgi:hypothetical protein
MDPHYTLGEELDSWLTRGVDHLEIRHQPNGQVFVIVNHGDPHEVLVGHSLEADLVNNGRKSVWLIVPLLLLAITLLGFIIGLELMR